MNSLLILFIAHALGDFYLQTNKMAQDKYNCLCYRSFIYSLAMLLGVIVINTHLKITSVLLMVGGISLVHLVVDLLGIWLNSKMSLKSRIYNFFIFAIDQTIHLIAIYVCLHYFFGHPATLDVNAGIVLLFIIVYAMKPTSIFIGKIVSLVDETESITSKNPTKKEIMINDFDNKEVYYMSIKENILTNDINTKIERKENYDSTKDGFYFDSGTIIGIIERLLIIAIALTGSINSIAIIIAAKTMVRYGQFEGDNGFRAKYLVGTLSSIFMGIGFF